MSRAPSPIEPVRDAVDRLLAQSAAFQELPLAQQEDLRRDMTRVGAYLADPALLGRVMPGSVQARALEGPPEPPWARGGAGDEDKPPADQLQGRLAQKPGHVGAEFQAGAMRQGVEEFGKLVQKVDFPKFVSGLIQGVFQAIVDASIQQMQAYSELLAATAKSVDQFADDHISDAQARDYVANRFPSLVRIDTSGDGPATLKLRGDAEPSALVAELGAGDGLDDEEQERELVRRAKLQMAQSRQQTLATMVLMGINRIIVTDGKINAKVVFDISASDAAARRARAQMHDEQASSLTAAGGGGIAAGILTPYVIAGAGGGAGGGGMFRQDHTTKVMSAVDDTSESKAQMKAQLSGDVHINFKSETFPLERMIDVMGMASLNAKAQPQAMGPRGAPAPPAPAGAAR